MTGGLFFGTAGAPHSSGDPGTAGGIRRVQELGLGCMEIEFVQGVRMGEATARQVGQVARETGIRLSAHAPYYVNLNAREPEKRAASRQRLLQTARVGYLCGARDATAHVAFYLGDPPAEVYRVIKKALEEITALLLAEGVAVTMRPELMGKATQFGNLEELLALSSEVEGVLPTIDISHLHAISQGKFNSYDEFIALLKRLEGALGREKGVENVLFHVSGIQYTRAGERKHLDLKDSDFNYRDLLRALKDYGARGNIVCESPNLEEDALLLQETYRALS